MLQKIFFNKKSGGQVEKEKTPKKKSIPRNWGLATRLGCQRPKEGKK